MPDLLGDFAYTWPFYAAGLAGYLLGAIPFGLVLTMAAGLGDIRKVGSGNIGATNVLRTGNRWLAAATLLLDGGKGAGAALIAGQWGPDMAIMAGAGAFIGHLFPIWIGFKGGKGVATALGVLLALAWPVGLAAAAIWAAVFAAFRISSLAALTALAAAPFLAWAFAPREMIQVAAFLAVFVWAKHHANIRRLLKGDEPRTRLGGGAPPSPRP
jgi:glycerol-3-phosphate acyltransferase PlsY